MEQEQRQAAKRQMLECMQAGQSWQAASAAVGLQVSRSTSSWWQHEVRMRGEAALHDGRQGHPAKVLPRVLHWLEARLQATSQVPSSQLQRELQEQLDVRISISHLNAVRASHGWSNTASRAGKNQRAVEASVQEGAAGLLLVAAAHETGLLCELETAIASWKWPQPISPLPYPIKKTRFSPCASPSSVTFVARFQARRPKKTPMKSRACPRGGGRTGKRSRRQPSQPRPKGSHYDGL